MAIKYIKKAAKTPETDDHKTQAAVQDILNDIAKRKEEALKDLNKKFDKYEGEVIVSKEKIPVFSISNIHDLIFLLEYKKQNTDSLKFYLQKWGNFNLEPN